LRDIPILHFRNPIEKMRCLALSETPERELWWQERSPGKPKRFKSIMKQVVGSPFTGLLDKSLESRIVDGLIAASQGEFDNPGLSHQDRTKWLKRLLEPRIKELKDLIGTQLSVYLQSIVSRLLDTNTKLRWTPTSNNCQNFCDALIDLNTFGPLVANPPERDQEPGPKLYLLSFVCRPAGYTKPTIKSRFDVPRGLTEEYLLRFRYGRHDEADIIDSLQEYWHDWGAFGKHLYKYQDIFPWDCTEAFGRYPVTCGKCNLAKHVWAFPFDSFSIVSLHLTRDRYNYPPDDKTTMTDVEWMRNRLLVLSAQEKLILAAEAMASNASFKDRTDWLHKQADPTKDRLKLGGIHRAQPFSHSYEQGKYQHYFIASWAHLKLEDQIAEYELLRDGRVKLPDVEFSRLLYSGAQVNPDGCRMSDGDITSRIFDAGSHHIGVESSMTDAMMDASMGFSSMDGRGGGHDQGDGACAFNCETGCGSSECSSGYVGDGGDGCSIGQGCG
jgi:hypothetical protein